MATKTKPRTAVEYRRLVENIIVPAFGHKRVREVTRGDVSRLHHEQRATPYAANRTLAVLSKMFALAEKWGERSDGSNPCRHVEKYVERKRERMLSAQEFGRLADALEASSRSPYALAAIKLLAFSGARLSEVLNLKWEWVDFERGEARLPDSKTGAKTLHLPAPALAVLADLPRVRAIPTLSLATFVGLGWSIWRSRGGPSARRPDCPMFGCTTCVTLLRRWRLPQAWGCLSLGRCWDTPRRPPHTVMRISHPIR